MAKSNPIPSNQPNFPRLCNGRVTKATGCYTPTHPHTLTHMVHLDTNSSHPVRCQHSALYSNSITNPFLNNRLFNFFEKKNKQTLSIIKVGRGEFIDTHKSLMTSDWNRVVISALIIDYLNPVIDFYGRGDNYR